MSLNGKNMYMHISLRVCVPIYVQTWYCKILRIEKRKDNNSKEIVKILNSVVEEEVIPLGVNR